MSSVDPFGFEGQRILITGGASGIGAEAARMAVARGASIVVVDRDDASALAREIGAVAYQVDVTDRAAVQKLASDIGEIDALVLAAGIQPPDNWDSDGWAKNWASVMAVNTYGPAVVVEAFWPKLKDGRIVLVGSQAGRNGGEFAAPHYVASKGGLHALCRWLARKGLHQSTLVNAVAPGPVDTPFIEGMGIEPSALPLGRICTAREVAAPILFLLSPASAYITGAILDINGGMSFN